MLPLLSHIMLDSIAFPTRALVKEVYHRDGFFSVGLVFA
jgi:hypothetical protein